MGAKSDKLFGRIKSASDDLRVWQIKFLEDIALAVAPAGGLATESTAISILNAIVASDQDIEILLVRDTGDSDKVLQQITNYQTGVPVVTYKDVNGNTVTPVGPLEYLDPAGVLNLMLTELVAINASTTSIDTKVTGLNLEATQLLVKGVLDTIKTDTGAMVIDLAAIEVLLTTIDTVLDNIKLDTASIDTATTNLNTPVTGLATALLVVTGAGAATVTAGKRRVSFMNTGAANTTVAGTTLKRGLSITFSAEGLRDTLAAISYDALTSELTITTVG